MKIKNLNRSYLLLLILVIGLANQSCQKDDNGVIRAKMSATIGGSEWTAAVPIADSYSDKIIISGVSMTGATVTITVFGDSDGAYSTNPLTSGKKANVTYKKSLTSSTEDAYTSVLGNVSLDKIDRTAKRISGTFQVTVANTSGTITIENGVFTNVVFNLSGQ